MAVSQLALSAREAVVAGEIVESRLVEQCRRGDAQAFARLVALHEGMVFNLAARLLGDAEEARDACQDVFLQVYRRLGRFKGHSSLKTWIYRIVVNHCHNRQRWWRRRRMDRAHALEELTPAEEMRVAARESSRSSPFAFVERREQAQRLQEALLGMSFKHRAILLLREVEGLSCGEIAATLELPAGTVKSRLSRARELLRRRLLPEPGEGGRP
jgi:RNA polymerase sigma-70 factor (ECF subfamily)